MFLYLCYVKICIGNGSNHDIFFYTCFNHNNTTSNRCCSDFYTLHIPYTEQSETHLVQKERVLFTYFLFLHIYTKTLIEVSFEKHRFDFRTDNLSYELQSIHYNK